jgi:oxygen-dependent protoporphyrinogen oxidase
VDALGLRATLPGLAAELDAGAPSLTAAASRAFQHGESSVPARRVERSSTVSRASRHGESCVSIARHAHLDRPPPVFGALRGGYVTLVDALAAGADVRLSTTVRALHRRADGWRIVLGPGQGTVDVDAVVLAVPAPAVARLLAELVPSAADAARQIELASSAVVALAYRESDAATLPATSGVLVAAGEPVSIKAATHSSCKWPHLAPSTTSGLVRLRVSFGRFGEAATLQVDDAELIARARADLRALAGIAAPPIAAHVQRWGGGLPQYAVGHLDRVRAIEDAVAAVPGLAVAGATLHGVGVPACIATARAAADRLIPRLAPTPAQ